jgi:uncharacterized membrane protein (Fun14 family)
MASRSLRMMLGATVVGAGMWVYAAATRPPEAASTAAATSAGAQVSGGITPRSLTGSATPAGESAVPDVQEVADRAKRLIDESSPAMFRFGLSFVAAFFLGWLLRRFITLTLLVTGAVAAGVIALQRTGVIGIEGDDIRREAERSVGWLQGQAGAIRDVVTGYLPTGFAAILGGYKGFRH